ncbi:ABC transporter permease subunit [Zophobihabitans entericus]|uniref:ABC transporter permease subunit n=1 Tax=Zophobihabitans entericus TaxID=1635327 RepID=A0A6G9IB81_9GAMM|nr:ABC transporter permease subunit [Zophobihabitans entericus]QIQ20840.1 ABC transporter permease subunit [Zophobihabitans entericus]
MINKFLAAIYRSYSGFKRHIHNNLFLIIGFYGLVSVGFLCLLSLRFVHEIGPLGEKFRLMLPAWNEAGDVKYILGTDKGGYDIFIQLLLAMRTTLSVALQVTLVVTILGGLFSYLLLSFKSLRTLIKTVLRIISSIPPLLIAIVIALFWGNSLFNLMIVIGLTCLPRFIYNVTQMVSNEMNKTYITVAKLDGLSPWVILNHSVLPNIRAAYLSEITVLFSNTLLGITTLSYLQFGTTSRYNELGSMMKEMVSIIDINPWAFIAPGLAILIVIVLVNFLDYGLNLSLSRRE